MLDSLVRVSRRVNEDLSRHAASTPSGLQMGKAERNILAEAQYTPTHPGHITQVGHETPPSKGGTSPHGGSMNQT